MYERGLVLAKCLYMYFHTSHGINLFSLLYMYVTQCLKWYFFNDCSLTKLFNDSQTLNASCISNRVCHLTNVLFNVYVRQNVAQTNLCSIYSMIAFCMKTVIEIIASLIFVVQAYTIILRRI